MALIMVSLRQNGVGTGFTSADAILPRGHKNVGGVISESRRGPVKSTFSTGDRIHCPSYHVLRQNSIRL